MQHDCKYYQTVSKSYSISKAAITKSVARRCETKLLEHNSLILLQAIIILGWDGMPLYMILMCKKRYSFLPLGQTMSCEIILLTKSRPLLQQDSYHCQHTIHKWPTAQYGNNGDDDCKLGQMISKLHDGCNRQDMSNNPKSYTWCIPGDFEHKSYA